MDIETTIRDSNFKLVRPFQGFLMLFNDFSKDLEHGQFTIVDPRMDINEAVLRLMDSNVLTMCRDGKTLGSTIYKVIGEDR